MTLQQLNYIITISEIGSINRAAERLYISQPSLTSAVKELEKELGIVLFNRTGRGVTLTGLSYSLQDAALTPAFPLGVSNRFTGAPAEIRVKKGFLAVYFDGEPDLVTVEGLAQ